jgi:hypothetical protein
MRQIGPGAYNLLFKIPARGEDLRHYPKKLRSIASPSTATGLIARR